MPFCPNCGAKVDGKICTQCGNKMVAVQPKKPIYKKWWFWVIIVVVLAGIGAAMDEGEKQEGFVSSVASKFISSASVSDFIDSAPGTSVEPVVENSDLTYLETLKVYTADVLNGSNTTVIGECAYVIADKSVMTDNDLLTFAYNIVDGSNYNWFTIDFGDGTGIQFIGCAIAYGTYGKIDEMKRVVTEYGNYIFSSNSVKYKNTSDSQSSAPISNISSMSQTPSSTETTSSKQSSVVIASSILSSTIITSKASSTSSAIIVYITATGKKYHRSGCRYLDESKIEMTLEEAKALGYTPCGVCNPPE